MTLVRWLAAQTNPQRTFTRRLRAADAANRARDWPRAAQAYAAALDIDPLRADLWVQYGHALKEQAQLAEAERAYAAAADLDRGSSDALEHLGHLQAARGDRAAAVTSFSAALARDPGRDALRTARLASGGEGEVAAAPPALVDVEDMPPRASDGAVRPHGARRGRSEPAPVRRRPPIAFIHLHKTGGLTLHGVLERHVAPWRVCPVKDDHLHFYSRAELARFDLVSGHFDWGALRLLGPGPVRTVSVLREPKERLISFYRFHSGHHLGGRHGVNAFAQMANAMSAEEFFEHPAVRHAPEVFNHYLVAFGLGYHQVHEIGARLTADRVPQETVRRAVERVRGLDGIGLTRRFDESAALVSRSLGLPAPTRIKTINETDKLAQRMKGAAPPRVVMTPRLEAALEELVRFDVPIYEAAVAEFERRLAAAKAT